MINLHKSMGPGWDELATPANAVRHVSAVRHISDCNYLDGEERDGCFTLFSRYSVTVSVLWRIHMKPWASLQCVIMVFFIYNEGSKLKLCNIYKNLTVLCWLKTYLFVWSA